MAEILSWEQQDQTMAFNILHPDTFKPPLDPDPEFEGRSTLYRLSRGPYAAAETALLACLADPR